MDIKSAILQRRSIRAFKPDPVPEVILRDILGLAVRAPSWSNVQPWEFSVASGAKLKEIKKAFAEKTKDGIRAQSDFAAPGQFPEPFDSRRRVLGRKIFEIKGIGREDREKRAAWGMQGLMLFGAPCCIYILTDRAFVHQEGGMNVWPLFDCGLAAENIMLSALEYGLGTIPEIQAVAYPDILRRVLSIPDSKLLMLGIAIGYPDNNDPINQLRSEREQADSIVTWHGLTT